MRVILTGRVLGYLVGRGHNRPQLANISYSSFSNQIRIRHLTANKFFRKGLELRIPSGTLFLYKSARVFFLEDRSGFKY
jgi:hypothetical protein